MIKSKNYITEEVRIAAEQEAFARLVSDFSEVMFEKFVAKLKQGYNGWDRNTPDIIESITTRLGKNIEKGDWVDVANLAMFLWNMEQPDVPSDAPSVEVTNPPQT